MQKSSRDQWEQEEYWLLDETISAFKNVGILVNITKISEYACVFDFKRFPDQNQ
jgi:hypothetical protein